MELNKEELKLLTWIERNVHTNAGTVILTSIDADRVNQELADIDFKPELIDIKRFRDYYFGE